MNRLAVPRVVEWLFVRRWRRRAGLIKPWHIERPWLRAAVVALPPLEQLIIELRYGAEHEVGEVASTLRLPAWAIKRIERKALRRLRSNIRLEAVTA
jgi:DNA-directed RNA polymerase specialized sigma subunit